MAIQNADWIDKNEYPFTSRYVQHSDGRLHYVDEGSGDVILFVHGTPEWSFTFRHLIKAFSLRYRCIAVDHLGFGLSDKPHQADYTVKAHSERLTWFIDKLGLKNINCVAHDFGGGIALGYVVNHVENIKSITLSNTWCWSLNNDPHYTKPSKIINTWIGKFLYKQLNFPVNVIMPQAYGNRKKLTKEIHRHYKMPLNNSANRVAAYEIARELMNAGSFWDHIWERLVRRFEELRSETPFGGGIEHKPILLLWGMNDTFVPPKELSKWQKRFPNAQVVKLNGVGHFTIEEAPQESIDALTKFLNKVVA